jgi:hypothetical protein
VGFSGQSLTQKILTAKATIQFYSNSISSGLLKILTVKYFCHTVNCTLAIYSSTIAIVLTTLVATICTLAVVLSTEAIVSRTLAVDFFPKPYFNKLVQHYMTTLQTATCTLPVVSTPLAAVTCTLVLVLTPQAVDTNLESPQRFPSPFAKRTNQPCNPNFAKKLVNLPYALAIFQIAKRWHCVSVSHMSLLLVIVCFC